ncbi:MAG: cysteine desulfurase [Lachnospiraceae bacterium]|nr:cysteine desulfurase [Lachnospiraceae bacterium]
MECYLDNSATTRPYKEVVDIVSKTMLEDYGNPSSMHTLGVETEKMVRLATENIAKTLKAEPKEIIFTSGGTESDNMAIMGTAKALKRKGMHIIVSPFEHPAVERCMEILKKEGFEISYLSVDSKGLISIDELRSLIREDTILVSVMAVNNEIGVKQDLEAIGKTVKECNQGTYYMVDAVQAFGKISINVKKMKIDLLSVSGHKINGPKGIGILYVNSQIRIVPLINGGGQQGDMRSGTDNVPGILGLEKAVSITMDHLDEEAARLYELRSYLIEKLGKLEDVYVNGGDNDTSAPHIVSISVKGIRSEVLLHSLEEKNIYVSAGSACSSHKRTPSKTLTAIGVDKDLIASTVRVSMGVYTTKEELDYFTETLSVLLDSLRLYVRR